MSDEEFCVRAALLVHQCPAFCCPGGDHSEIPNICVQWWKSTGWEIMKWEGQAQHISSSLIKKMSTTFLKDLEDKQINQSGRRGELNGSFLSQLKGNSEERMMDNPNEMVSTLFAPSKTPGKQHSQVATTNQNLLCENAVEVEFQQNMERAKAISRSETADCLHVTKLIPLGIKYAGSLGILCRWPRLPIDGNSIIPMNGNCVFTCFVHANNPMLRGASLEQAVWELRVRAVGTFIERLKLFDDEEWSLLQAIATGKRKEPPSRDEIKQEMEKYMESGEYGGDLGDIIINIAASFLQQPVLVIEVKGCKVTNSHWVAPNTLFGGENHSLGYPVVVLSQLNHYEALLIAEEAKDTTQMKFRQWNTSKRVCVSPGKGNLNENWIPDDAEDGRQNLTEQTMLEPDGIFSPPLASTPQSQQHHVNPQQQQMGDPWSGMTCGDNINQARSFAKIFQ